LTVALLTMVAFVAAAPAHAWPWSGGRTRRLPEPRQLINSPEPQVRVQLLERRVPRRVTSPSWGQYPLVHRTHERGLSSPHMYSNR
jgi:hypothetical protein